jgi:hypothetical protein
LRWREENRAPLARGAPAGELTAASSTTGTSKRALALKFKGARWAVPSPAASAAALPPARPTLARPTAPLVHGAGAGAPPGRSILTLWNCGIDALGKIYYSVPFQRPCRVALGLLLSNSLQGAPQPPWSPAGGPGEFGAESASGTATPLGSRMHDLCRDAQTLHGTFWREEVDAKHRAAHVLVHATKRKRDAEIELEESAAVVKKFLTAKRRMRSVLGKHQKRQSTR